ncbi:MAG: hypothetical protein JNK72_19575 [Myxococcales bacterium]|nr:hypothetical protein [Myxococcales bacterium]
MNLRTLFASAALFVASALPGLAQAQPRGSFHRPVVAVQPGYVQPGYVQPGYVQPAVRPAVIQNPHEARRQAMMQQRFEAERAREARRQAMMQRRMATRQPVVVVQSPRPVYAQPVYAQPVNRQPAPAYPAPVYRTRRGW